MPMINVLGIPHAYDLTLAPDSTDALVFIHGWLLSRSYWQPLIDQLSPNYQCLSYDLRGFGDSQLNSALATASRSSLGYSLLDYAKDLAILLKQLDITNVWLIGHSLGGSIALWAADQLPHLVKGVICINAGGGIYLKEEFERFRAAGQQLAKFRPRWLQWLPLVDLLFARANVVQKLDRHWGQQRLIDFVMADAEAVVGSLLDSTTEAEVHRLPQIVARLSQPVYFLAGAQDRMMEPKYVRHLASFHPLFCDCGDNVFEIPDCGHLAMLEQPELVAEKIRWILTEYP